MDQEVKTNRIILAATFVLMLILAGFLLKFYIDQKRENASLRVKLLTMTANRRKPTTLEQLTSRKSNQAVATNTAKPERTDTTNKENSVTNSLAATSDRPIADRPVEDLAGELNLSMRNAQAASATDLDRSIAIAEEIISREPASYAAYKAKLMALLIKEGKYNQEADDGEINELLETMAGFDVTTDTVARREAALLSNANTQLSSLEDTLRSIAQERIDLDEEIASLDPATDEYARLQQVRAELLQQEQQTTAQLAQFENTIQSAINDDSYLNEDIVEIPFMRSMARGDFETVEEDAVAFIEQFPTSVSGYYYLIRSLDSQGRQAEATEIIANSQLSQEAQRSLLDRVEQNRNQDPKQYWKRLTF